MSKIIIEKIASEAGVSVATVHRLLAKGTKDKRPTFVKRAKFVAELAAKYNYRPSAAAKSMRNRQSNNIGLIMGPEKFRSRISQEFMQGILDELNQQQQRLVVARLSEDVFDREEVYPRMLTELTCDGLLINYQSETPEALSTILKRLGLPVIWINDDKEGDCVRPDDRNAAKMLTEMLMKQGHKKIAYVDIGFELSGDMKHYSKWHRKKGYEEAISNAGLTPMFISDKGFTENRNESLAQLNFMLNADIKPTAFVCYSTEWRIIEHVILKQGNEFGKPPALATFCSDSEVGFSWPVNCAVVPQYEVGKQSIDMLLTKIQNPKEVQPTRKLKFKILTSDRPFFLLAVEFINGGFII